MQIKYGKGFINLAIEKSYFSQILSPIKTDELKNYEDVFSNLINADEEDKNLGKLLKNKIVNKVAIIVEDKTRKNPEYPFCLKNIIEIIKNNTEATIYLVIAYGTHCKHKQSENEILYGRENLNNIVLIDHDAFNQRNLKSIGKLSSGIDLKINKYVAESDFIITFGSVAPHAFAGFTGGRKCILPGVCSYENINFNHSKVCLDNTKLGILDENPINKEMIEASKLVNIDYTIQTVRNNLDQLTKIFVGNLEKSFFEAVAYCQKINEIKYTKLADLTIVSCGGVPKDKTLYQSQRSLAVASKVTKPGGLIILFSKMENGIGDECLAKCIQKPNEEILSIKQSEITVGIHSAYLYSRYMSKYKIKFYCDLPDEIAAKSHMDKICSIDEVKKIVLDSSKNNELIYFIPNGSSILT